MKNTIFDVLSVDETKLSALILCLFALTATTIYMYISTGLIDSNMRDLVGVFVAAVAGINVADVFRRGKADVKIEKREDGGK